MDNTLSTSLNSSPTPKIQEAENSETPNVNKFLNGIKSEVEVQNSEDRTIMELHRKRVQNLRKELDYLKETGWKYQSVDRNWDYNQRS